MKLLCLIVLFSAVTGIHGKCVWYGQCYGSGYKIRNCPYDGPPKPLPEEDKEEALALLHARCPLFLEKYKDGKFCCDLDMLKSMSKGMALAEGVFGRCPTCTFNLYHHICEFTCSPMQHTFVKPRKILQSPGNDSKAYIQEVDMYFTEEFFNSTFKSCKDIVMPSTGEKAMTMACNNDAHCTPKKWFATMGDASGVMVPFQINYVQPEDEEHQPLYLTTLRCNDSYEGFLPCSCTDCEESCFIPFEDPTSSEVVIVMDALAYSTFTLISLVLLSAVCFFGWARKFKAENPEFMDRWGDGLNSGLEMIFTRWGELCSKHPALVLAVSSFVVAELIHGIPYLEITTQPDEIWAAPSSQSRKEKEYFDTKFSPFYRTNQIFMTTNLSSFNWTDPGSNVTLELGPIFLEGFLREVYNLQMKIQQIGVKTDEGLEKICFAPMRNNYTQIYTVDQCTVQSVWGYLQNDVKMLNDENEYLKKLTGCLINNYNVPCLAPYGGPIFSPLAVIGFEEVETESDGVVHKKPNYLSATGISLTFLLDNHVNKAMLEPALKWEKEYIGVLKNWTENEKPNFINIAFSAERSIQDEIERESNAEMGTMLISYFIMFVYIAVALGKFRKISTLLVDSRIMLAVGGIVIVIASVLTSLGVFGFMGIPTTLLTIEVIPFLILAVGVDNIFILVHTIENLPLKARETVEDRIGRALGKVGPSVLLTSVSEASCFLIGSLSNMPAVKTFALYSSVAILFNFLLQFTVFVSWLAIDLRRMKVRRLDIICCVSTKKEEEPVTKFGFLNDVFQNHYGPLLMRRPVRLGVIGVFIVCFIISAYLTTQIELGLDQEMSMPEDSYLIDYFKSMRDLFAMGPPVYFVIKSGLNYSNWNHTNAICGTVGCDQDSFITYLTLASRTTNLTYLMKSPSSWIDDYFAWMGSMDCCKMNADRTYCSTDIAEFCFDCDIPLEGNRPSIEDFNHFLPFFLTDNPTETCPKAGGAAYSGAVNFKKEDGKIGDTYFMAYHSVLKTSKDYYTAMDRARNVATHVSKTLSEKLKEPVEVFPYSVFYVFYEQYLTIISDAILSLTLTLITVFAATFIFTGFDYISSLLVLLTISSILVNLMGIMYLWDITLNAISLVNLIVSVGIGVEFCNHLVHSFAMHTMHDKTTRVLNSIGTIGSSVFSGITLTKFCGIIVLAFARSQIFRVFYFRMYLSMVLVGAAHGLILLPVLLSYFGPQLNKYRIKRLGPDLQ